MNLPTLSPDDTRQGSLPTASAFCRELREDASLLPVLHDLLLAKRDAIRAPATPHDRAFARYVTSDLLSEVFDLAVQPFTNYLLGEMPHDVTLEIVPDLVTKKQAYGTCSRTPPFHIQIDHLVLDDAIPVLFHEYAHVHASTAYPHIPWTCPDGRIVGVYDDFHEGFVRTTANESVKLFDAFYETRLRGAIAAHDVEHLAGAYAYACVHHVRTIPQECYDHLWSEYLDVLARADLRKRIPPPQHIAAAYAVIEARTFMQGKQLLREGLANPWTFLRTTPRPPSFR